MHIKSRALELVGIGIVDRGIYCDPTLALMNEQVNDTGRDRASCLRVHARKDSGPEDREP